LPIVDKASHWQFTWHASGGSCQPAEDWSPTGLFQEKLMTDRQDSRKETWWLPSHTIDQDQDYF